MVAEDDVDMETLQAQIDMTMSFAQNLVTSWIKPTHLPQLKPNGVNITRILEEELRRPPRLGVGSSIPTAPPLAHEASKLKRRLGKNGAKNEDVVKPQPQDSSKSDDEEHKGRPAKRKAKMDPFGHEGSKKKRKADLEVIPYLSVESVSKHSASLLNNSTSGEPKKHNSSSGKEKQGMGPDDQWSYVTREERSATLTSSPPVILSVQTTSSLSPTTPPASSPPKPSREAYGAPIILCLVPAHLPHPPLDLQSLVTGKTPTPESTRVHTNSMLTPDKANPLGIPLLNLDGPPELAGKPGNTSDLNNSRRKRKRRKKKKTQAIADRRDNSR